MGKLRHRKTNKLTAQAVSGGPAFHTVITYQQTPALILPLPAEAHTCGSYLDRFKSWLGCDTSGMLLKFSGLVFLTTITK